MVVVSENILSATSKGKRRVHSRVDTPLVSCSMMSRRNDPVSDSIPHLRVPAVEILLHPQRRLSLLVLSLPHPFELDERLLHRSRSVRASSSSLGFLSSSVDELLLGCNEADQQRRRRSG